MSADLDVIRAAVDQLLTAHGDAEQREFLAAQYDAGLAWVHFPVGCGGRGLAPALQVEVDTILERAGRSATWQRNPMGIGMVAPAIAAHGRPDQLPLLRRIFTAEDIWCQLFSEPGAGSDLAGLASRARRDGAGWRLSGSKVWTSLAHVSRYGLALARTDPDAPKHAGMSAFVVDMSAPGVTVAPLQDMTGARHFNEVFFDQVTLSDAALLGEPGDGWAIALTMLMAERDIIGSSSSARGTGAISTAVEAWRRSNDRHPAGRLELAELWVEAELTRIAAVRDREARLSGGLGAEGAKLKLVRAELDQRIARFAVESLGLAGLSYDAKAVGLTEAGDDAILQDPVRAWLQSQAYTIAGGTSDILRTLVADRVLRLPRESCGPDPSTPWSQIPR